MRCDRGQRSGRARGQGARVWLAAAGVLAGSAQAGAAAGPSNAEIFLHWRADPVAILFCLGVGWIYLRGLAWHYARDRAVADWRPMAFLGGLALVLLALVSPLAWLAGRLYWLHQAQDALLRVIGPLLMFLSEPWRILLAGLPAPRRRWLRPLHRDRPLRRLLAGLCRPALLAPLFAAPFVLWQIPALQEAGRGLPLIGWLASLSMLAMGCLFFATLFDPRDPPTGMRYGIRTVLLVPAILSQILLGAALTLKTVVLYPGYGASPRLFGMSALDDEAAGGFLNWAPVSMVLLIAVLLVFTRWNRSELRLYARARRGAGSNSAALLLPETAEELWLMVTPRNRRLGWSLALIPIAMMGLAIGTVVTVHYAQ